MTSTTRIGAVTALALTLSLAVAGEGPRKKVKVFRPATLTMTVADPANADSVASQTNVGNLGTFCLSSGNIKPSVTDSCKSGQANNYDEVFTAEAVNSMQEDLKKEIIELKAKIKTLSDSNVGFAKRIDNLEAAAQHAK